ncbi:MAG: AAC(3) family N-acetyltransferase [Armatimonadetes bacterium]|nr:AAC(3) family N-acetyltransferase [Armatimonadota bacterium]
MSSELTLSDLVRAFREVGIAPGDSFVVHSSFKSLGPVEGGPETVIDALVEAVGPGGNVVFPTFNYTQHIADPHFDPAVVPCRTGIIPELARKRPNAVRSLHPTHSVTVIGPDAIELTKEHMAYRKVGLGSPVDRLAKMGGKVLLLGVGHTTNTMVHLGEEYAGVPKGSWFEKPTFARVLMPDGSIHSHEIDTSTSCSQNFGPVGDVLMEHGEIRDGRAGDAMLQLMLAMDVVKRVCEMIREKPDALLCSRPECPPCTGARRNLGMADGNG